MIANYLIKLANFTPAKILIFGALAGVIYWKVLYNDGKAIDLQTANANKQLAEERKKEKESRDALAELETYRASMAGLQEQFRVAAQQLPLELTSAEILKTVDTIAKATNVRVRTKEPRPSKKEDFLELFPMKVNVIGTYSEITLFLYWLSSYERITRVINFSYTATSEKDAKPGALIFDRDIISYKYIGKSDGSGGKK